MGYFSDRPSAFVRALIISDAMLYASLNVINLLFAVFVMTKIPGGTVQATTGVVTIGLSARIITELVAGRRISRFTEKAKIHMVLIGMALISLSYFGFAWSQTLAALACFWAVNGYGWGIALPTKLSVASAHINPKQANQEWGLTDAVNMSLVIVTMIAGGYIVTRYDYNLLFMTAGALNLLGLLPYILYLKTKRV